MVTIIIPEMISDLVHGPICSSSNFILVLTGFIESILGGDKYIITIGRPAKPISPGKIPPNAQYLQLLPYCRFQT